MVLIYDFDGTLTPSSMPQYDILKECGYDDEKIMSQVKKTIITETTDLYQAYFQLYQKILKAHDYQMTHYNICKGAKDINFNKGVSEYFKALSNTDIKNYIITSGFEIYVKETIIAPYINGVFGTTYHYENGIATTINRLVTSQYKKELIKHIQNITKCDPKEIVYFGDGLTDKDAFQYINEIGGTTIFISQKGYDDSTYKGIKEKVSIDHCFTNDFSLNSELYQFILSLNK